MKIKLIAKNLLKHTPFYPIHIGNYIRSLYFWKYLKKLPIKNFIKVLDAGCGKGQYAIKMAQNFPWIEVTAMDIKMQYFQNNRPHNVVFRQGNLLELKDNNAYDFIYCIDVLEHVPNNIKVLQNFYQTLKSCGYLYLHVPYDIGKKRIFSDIFFNEFNEWSKHQHIGKQYTLSEMTFNLQKIGFKVVNAEQTFGSLGELAWELDRITDKRIMLKAFIMPLLKALGQLSVRVKHKAGNILVLAQNDGEHYWEIGKADYPLSKIISDINKSGLKLRRHIEYLSTLIIGFSYWKR